MNIYKWGVTHMSHVTLKNKSLSSDRVTSLYQFPPAAKCIHSLQKSNSPPSDCKNPSQPSDWKTHPIFRLELEPPQLTSVTFQTVAFSLIEINFLISKLNSRFTVWKIHHHLPGLELEPQL